MSETFGTSYKVALKLWICAVAFVDEFDGVGWTDDFGGAFLSFG